MRPAAKTAESGRQVSGSRRPASRRLGPGRRWLAGAAVAVSLLAGGCVDDRLKPTQPDIRLDTFVQKAVQQVDVLFVIDNSPSTEDKQANLARNFTAFFTYLQDAKVDYHIAVTTTDVDGTGPGSQGRLFGTPAVITPATPDPLAAFARNAAVGTGGASRESGLDAARRTLELRPEGFLRPAAGLFLVFVSDDEDQSEPGVPRFFQRFFELQKGKGNEALVSGGAIVGDLPDGCFTATGGEARAGRRYREVVDLIGGRSGSICDAQFDQTLRDLGVEAVGLKRRWPLTRVPDRETLSVTVHYPCESVARFPLEKICDAPALGRCAAGAATVACTLRMQTSQNADGWSLDAPNNFIVFHGAALPPHEARIEVRYIPRPDEP